MHSPSILPNESAVDDKYYQIFIDRGDMTGRFNFYKEFLETNDLNFEAKSFFKVIRKIRYNWKNSAKKKSFFRDIYSKLLNFKNYYGIKNFTKLIKFIKSEFLIKYNFEALNYDFCYKKPKKFE